MRLIQQMAPVAGGTAQRLTVSTAAVGFASSFPDNARYVLVEVQTNPLYVTFDGSTPSATNGYAYAAGTREIWSKAQAQLAKAVRQGAADGFLYATGFAL